MGIIRKVEEDPRAAIMYISGTGNIISVTKAFTSLSGMPAEDLAGRHASVVFPKAGEVTGFVQDAVSGDLQNKASGGTLEMRSRFGETFQVAATAKVGGSADYPILSVTVVTQGQETPSLVLSASGEVLHCNAALESSVGAPATSIVGSKALDLFTEPYRTYFRDLLRAGDYNTHRFDATVLHGRVIQLAAKGSRGFRGLAAVRHLDAGTTEGNPAAMLTLTPLGPGANAEVPPNLELTIGEDGAVTDCTVHEGPIAALKEAIVGQRVNQLVRMEGNVARHLAYWKTLPESSAPRGMARPTASAPSRPTHVAVSVPGQTAVAAAASWRRCGGATCVSLVPYQTLGIVLEVDQSLKITAVLGQAVLLTGASAESIKGKHLRDVLPGLNGEVADIPSLLASGEKKSGGMKKKRAASGRMPGVAVASTLCTGIQATVQAVSRGTSKAAWVVVDPDPAFAVPALPEPDEGVIQAGTARAEALMAHEGKDKESGSNGGAEGVAEPADEEEKKEEEKKEDEKEEEENGSEGRSGEEGSDEGEGLEKADGAAGSGGWAAQRVEEWVTQGGVVTSGDSVGGYGEATGLSASAVRQLEHGLKGLRTDSMQGADVRPFGGIAIRVRKRIRPFFDVRSEYVS